MSRPAGAGAQPRESSAAQQASCITFHLMNDNTPALTTLRGASGKSTLFKLIGGLATPSTGTSIGNNRLRREREGGTIARLRIPGPTLLAWRTVAGSVHRPLMLAGMSTRQTQAERFAINLNFATSLRFTHC
jgi:ABC-type nitrate/sulfonate/bicarbonate transport system ATPase subunit